MNDMYRTFEDENLNYCYIPPTEYSITNDVPEYEWDYGDSVAIPFYIDRKYHCCTIRISIYNFRFEEIYQDEQEVDPDGAVTLIINSEMSDKLFKRGNYYCRLQARKEGINNNSIYGDFVSTILPAQCCQLYVR